MKQVAFENPVRAQVQLMIAALATGAFTASCLMLYLKYTILAQQIQKSDWVVLGATPMTPQPGPLIMTLLMTGAAMGAIILGFLLVFWWMAMRAEKYQKAEQEKEAIRLRRRYDP